MPLVKWFLAIPHFAILMERFIGVVGASIAAGKAVPPVTPSNR